jgi:hypothetical protein
MGEMAFCEQTENLHLQIILKTEPNREKKYLILLQKSLV